MQLAADAPALLVLDARQFAGQHLKIRQHMLALEVEQRLRHLVGDTADEVGLVDVPLPGPVQLRSGHDPGQFAGAEDRCGEDRPRSGQRAGGSA